MNDKNPSDTTRRPRIVIAGEFSAGKTRLLNGILGQTILPSHVVSTSLPPMWLSSGDGDPLRLDVSGSWHELTDFDAIDVRTTRFCVLQTRSPALDHIDLIDTPGNSDPNLPAECWERMIPYADLVVWCSNANQAWRQSEKAVWEEMPDHLCGISVMVLTHADLIPDDMARAKVRRRVEREAGGFFQHIEMVSALDSAQVADFAARLVDMARNLTTLGGIDAPDFNPDRILPEVLSSARSARRPRGKVIVPRRLMPAGDGASPSARRVP